MLLENTNVIKAIYSEKQGSESFSVYLYVDKIITGYYYRCVIKESKNAT